MGRRFESCRGSSPVAQRLEQLKFVPPKPRCGHPLNPMTLRSRMPAGNTSLQIEKRFPSNSCRLRQSLSSTCIRRLAGSNAGMTTRNYNAHNVVPFVAQLRWYDGSAAKASVCGASGPLLRKRAMRRESFRSLSNQSVSCQETPLARAVTPSRVFHLHPQKQMQRI